MYKIILRTVIIGVIMTLFSLSSYAQVGIGTTTPNNNAALDITSTTQGVLLPRILLTSTTSPAPLGSDVAGMLVYNTATATDVTPGFYFNDGTNWIRIGKSDWSRDGNTGTIAGTNFIGTTDTEDFIVKTDNTERVRIASDGKVGISENSPTNATLEIGGNLIIGNTFTGGTATAQTGGLTIEGRTIVGEDDFFYGVDKFVVYGNTTWAGASATNGDNGNGLIYALNAYTSAGIGLYAEDNDGGIGVQVIVDDTALLLPPIGVDAIDNSGIGTAISGDIRNPTSSCIAVYGTEPTQIGWAMYANGDLNVVGNTYNISDKKYKKNIAPITNALKIIEKLKPQSYNLIWSQEKYKNVGFNKTTQMGFLAQDLEKVLPNLVKTSMLRLNNINYSKKEISKNPKLLKIRSNLEEFKAVNYIQLIPLLTQAIKEQQKMIESLENTVYELSVK